MKKKTYIPSLLIALAMIVGVSCKDDDAVRIPDVMDAVNMRIQINPERSYFDYNDIDNAYLEYSVYSENKDIDKVEIIFQYVNSVEGDTTDPQVIKTYRQGDFVNGTIKNQKLTSAELTAALGIEIADLAGGDMFLFLNRTTLTDQRVYPSATVAGYENVPADIRLASSTTSYTTVFDAIVGCPPDAAFTGKYTLEQIGGPRDEFNDDDDIFSEGEIEIESTGPITRTFNVGYIAGSSYDFDTDFAFTLLCGEIVVSPIDSGIGCGGPRFTYQSTGSNPYDPTDDSVITINIMQNTTGACGVPANQPLVLKLTKK